MSIAPIVIEMLLRGMPQIAQGMRNVSDVIARGEKQTTRTTEREARARVTAAQRERKEREKEYAQLFANIEKREKKSASIRERSATMAGQLAAREANREAKAVERAEREKVKAVEKAEAQKRAIRERSASMAGQFAAREARREAAATAKTTRLAESAQKERNYEAFLDRRRAIHAIGGAAAQGVMAAGSRISNYASQVGGIAAQLGGGFTIADSVTQRGTLERNAALLANSAYIPGKAGNIPKGFQLAGNPDRADPAKLAAAMKVSSINTRIDAAELMEGTKAYIAKTGNFAEGVGNTEFFGKLAKSTGTDMKDIAKTAGILRVQNKNLDEGAMKQLLLDVVMQGRKGSVELEDMAAIGGKITRTSSSYAGSQTENQRKLLGLSQIAIRTSGSPEEAATVLSNISQDAMKHSKAMTKVLGKDTFNANGQIAASPEEFLANVMEKTGGNLQKIQGLGFGARSLKMFQALAPTFNDARDEALKANPKDKAAAIAAGRRAVLGDINDVTAAHYDEKSMNEDFGVVANSGGEKLEAVFRSLRMEVGEKLLPKFVEMAPTIAKLIPMFVNAADVGIPAFIKLLETVAKFAEANKGIIQDIAAHPIGSILAYEVTKSVGAAGLGEVIKRILSQGAPGAGGLPGGGGGGLPGGGIVPGAGGAGSAYKGGGHGGMLAMGAVAIGGALQAGKLGDLYGDITNSQAAGADEAQALIAKAKAGQGGEARARLAQAQGESGTFEQINAYAATASRYAAYANPATMLGKVGAEYAERGITGKDDTNEAETMKKFFKAEALVDTPGISAAIRNAIADGANQASANGSLSQAARGDSIPNRNP
jgi:hypothetical protein